jgi:hypothetical protein
LTAFKGLTMRHQRFACAHLSDTYLTTLLSPFPKSLTTTSL